MAETTQAASGAQQTASPRETGLACLAARDYPRAIAALTAAETQAPQDDVVLLALGAALQGARRHQEALARFARVAGRGPNGGAARMHSAFSLLALGQALAARTAARDAVALTPRVAASHFALGQAEDALGRFDAAERSFMTAVEIEPSAADLWARLAAVRRRAGDAAGAEEAMRRALELGPARPAPPRQTDASELKVWNPTEPRAALGLAVDYLSRKPAFERLPFGEWTRTLAHQAGRGQQIFVIDGAHRVLGYLGWALTSKPLAEDWLQGLKPLSDEDCRTGDIVIINAFAADLKAATNLLVESGRDLFKDKAALYFKRFYRDGRVRAMRLAVNDFVAAHLARAMSTEPPHG